MNDRTKLLGKYRTPRCKIGSKVFCEMRGDVVIRGIHEGLIQWPYTIQKGGGRPLLILYGDLVRAVRAESETAICHWWGVGISTVWKWRKTLGVEFCNEGTRQLMSRSVDLHFNEETRRKVVESTQRPERNAKIAASRRGKPMHPSIKAKLLKANLGRKLPKAQRKKMSEAHQKRGTRPPAAGVPWTEAEDAFLGTMLDREVAEKTGRTLVAVQCRRAGLGITAFRFASDDRDECPRTFYGCNSSGLTPSRFAVVFAR